jgi:hypothetical protein
MPRCGLPARAVKNLPVTWRSAPRRWGHPLHAICSYMAMFPPAIPRVFVDWLTVPGDTVYDPFSGRGTTILEACSSGRVGLGSDANPLAWILTSAKANPPEAAALKRRLADLRRSADRGDPTSEVPEIQAVFDPDVLGQLLWLREELSTRSSVDRYLYAVLLGILHANARRDGSPRGLTISMPNTFSMAPRYVMRFKAAHDLVPPKVNVLDAIEARVTHLGASFRKSIRGYAWLQDAATAIDLPGKCRKPKLIFTSPPYLGVMKYGKLNWLRLWLLSKSPRVIDSDLFASESLPKYLEFMSKVILRLEAVLAANGRICLMVGDVKRGEENLNLAAAISAHCLKNSGLGVEVIINDELPVRHKVSRIWRERRGHATKTDRILILSRPKTPRLPTIPSTDWAQVPRLGDLSVA